MRFTIVKTPNAGISHYLSRDDTCEQPFKRADTVNDASQSTIFLSLDFSMKK